MRKLAMLALAFASVAALSTRADDDEKKLDTPEKCVAAYKASMLKADAKAMLACFVEASRKMTLEHMSAELKKIQGSADARAKAAKELGVKPEDFDTMSPEDFFSARLAIMVKSEKEHIEKTKFEVTKAEAETAVVTITEGKEQKGILALAKNDGAWGIDIEASQKLEKEAAEKENEGSDGK